MVDATAPGPSLSPAQFAHGSDKDGRVMVEATSRGTTQRRAKDMPPCDASSAKKVAASLMKMERLELTRGIMSRMRRRRAL